MHSDYERKRFKRIYWLAVLAFEIILTCWCLAAWHGFTWKSAGILVIAFIFLCILYAIVYHSLDSVYREMENVSGVMVDIMEKKSEPPEEKYMEGTVGVFYSNFHKMVRALQESRNRELEEKIFLRDIISDISHQLKTPLASLNVFIDLLQENKVEDAEKRRQILNEASNQLNRMEWMVLSMLKLARIEAGAIQFEKEETMLRPLLMQAAAGVQFLLQKKQQSLVVDCEEDISFSCDEGWLTEAVINLLKNASDYSDKGKSIRIEVEQTKACTRIYIKDEGMGIPEAELPNVFKRFYRVNQEVNPNSVGIGLSLTKSIVEGMGGMIHVNSEEGKYTWFILTFVEN